MGAINQAFNQAAGAVAASSVAIKHAKESDFSKMNTAEHSALVAKSQAADSDAAAGEARIYEEKYADSDWHRAVSDALAKGQAYDKAKKRKNASPKTIEKKLTEFEASQKAMDELFNKIAGMQAVKERAVNQRTAADKATELAEKAKQKYQSKWGGK